MIAPLAALLAAAPVKAQRTAGIEGQVIDRVTRAPVSGALIIVLLWRAPNRRVSWLLVGALLCTEVLVQVGALSAELVGRYTVVPIGILTLMLVYGVSSSWPERLDWSSAPSAVGAAALALVLVVGVADFWRANPRQLRCIDCPSWAEQVDQKLQALGVLPR